MTTELTDDPELTSEDTAPDEPSKKFHLGNKKIKILVLLVIVMGLEGAALYFFLPQISSGNTQKTDDGSSDDSISADMIEVEIGKFIVTNDQAAGTVSMHLKFTITGVVTKSRELEFHRKVSSDHHALVRQTIESVWRSADMDELIEPDLYSIKLKIRKKINKILKQDYIRQVLVSDYTKTTI